MTDSLYAQEKEALMGTYSRFPLIIERGEGAYLYDVDGKRYLDFMAGIAVNALGHNHPLVVSAITEQAKKVVHVSNLYYNVPSIQLAMKMRGRTGKKVFFANSGTEANEGMVKLARLYQYKKGFATKNEVITFTNSFHGRTLAMLAATGQEKFRTGFGPMPEGFLNVPYNDLEALRAVVSEKTAAIMIEPIQMEGGVYPATVDFMRGVFELSREHGALVLMDEIQTSMGRSGTLFGYEQFGLVPDIFSLAKALGGGVPIGAFLANDDVAAAFGPGDHGTTFGGNPLATAVATAIWDEIIEGGWIESVRFISGILWQGLEALQAQHPAILEVRGRGLLIGLELDRPVRPIIERCLSLGLVIGNAGTNVIRLLPPLIISETEVNQALETFSLVLEEITQGSRVQ